MTLIRTPRPERADACFEGRASVEASGLAINVASTQSSGFGSAVAINAADKAPDWIELIPAGPEIVGRDGRRWRMSDPSKLVAAYAANRADLPIDWEHGQFHAAPKGEPAPAAGWIEAVEARNGALWGRVSWTPKGRAAIEAREYRYISPVFTFDPATGEVMALKCAGLVNRPNLQLPALNQEGLPPMWKKLLAALGLPETATEDEAVAAVKAMQAEKEVALNAAKNPPNNLFVPRADFDAALNRETDAKAQLAKIVEDGRKAKAEAAVAKAIEEGRIVPATKDYHLAACRTDDGLAAFEAMVAKVPVNPAAKPSGLGEKKPGEGQTALNAEEIAVTKMLGMSEADFIAAKNRAR